MDMCSPSRLAVLDGYPSELVGFESCKGYSLELLQCAFDLLLGRPILWRPRNYSRRVFILELKRIDQPSDKVRIPFQNLHPCSSHSPMIILGKQVGGGSSPRSRPSREKLNQHGIRTS